MSDRIEIKDNELNDVTGGKITYTWNGTTGSIGINGNNNFVLLDKNAFGAYYSQVKDTLSEKEILKNLMAKGIIKKP